jgi:hypothetical protein
MRPSSIDLAYLLMACTTSRIGTFENCFLTWTLSRCSGSLAGFGHTDLISTGHLIPVGILLDCRQKKKQGRAAPDGAIMAPEETFY